MEEPAVAESDSEVGEKKFLSLDLEEKDKKKLREAFDGGQKVYGMTVYIRKDCLLKAARAFLVFKAVEEFAEIIVYVPSSQDIEDEKFENDFSIFFTTEEDLDKVVTAAKNVSEIEDVTADAVSESLLVDKTAETSAPAATVVEEAPVTAPAAAPVVEEVSQTDDLELVAVIAAAIAAATGTSTDDFVVRSIKRR